MPIFHDRSWQGPRDKAMGPMDRKLILAIESDDCALMKSMLDQGADIELLDNDFFTPLNLAAFYGSHGCVQALLDRGALIETQNCHGMTPLICAVEDAELDCAKALLDAGARLDSRDARMRTPLIAASQSRQDEAEVLDTIRLLLDRGADPADVDEDGISAVEHATEGGHAQAAALMESILHARAEWLSLDESTPEEDQKEGSGERRGGQRL